MDTSALRHAVDDLAASLSEVTVGDLGLTAAGDQDLGGLYLRIVESTSGATPFETARDRLPAAADPYGAGYERAYRRAALAAIDGLATQAEADALATRTVAWAREVDGILGL